MLNKKERNLQLCHLLWGVFPRGCVCVARNALANLIATAQWGLYVCVYVLYI